MKKNLARMGLIFIIIILLVGTSIGPITGRTLNKTILENVGDSSDESDFDENITNLMKQGHMPSISACIIKNNSIVWSKGYGLYDIRNNKEATDQTVYLAASISKTVTATAIMQLWEQGLFDLDEDVNNYLPFNLRNPKYPDVNITFRMLLAHHSSLSGEDIGLFTFFSLLRFPYEWLEEYLVPGGKIYNPRNWIDAPPGERHCYSSVGFEILGYLIELISGQPFDQYCDENIFQPLDMMNTSFHIDDYDKNDLAIPYVWSIIRYVPLPNYEDRNYAAGGLRTSVVDLSHYLIAHMNGGLYKDTRVLEEETVELMHTLQYSDNGYNYSGYGLGWRIFRDYGDDNSRRIGHTGAIPGTLTYMFYHTSSNIGIIFFTNQHLLFRPIELFSWFSVVNMLDEKANEF